MQVLMAASAHARLRERGPSVLDQVEVTTLDAAGRFGGAGVEDPEIYWVGLDTVWDRNFRPLLERAAEGRRGKWLQTCAAGIDSPGFKAVMANGLRVSKSDAQAPPIAEYVMAHALSLLHPIAEQAANQAARGWGPIEFREIAATRWLMIGHGSIGKEIASRLAPFGAKLDVVRRSTAPMEGVDRVATLADLHGLAAEADVVVLACPLNDDTRELANEGFFAALKPGAILINIGRGDLVDEDALKAGLERMQPAFAVLDVTVTEPLPADHWLWAHPRVRVTPHTSYAGTGVVVRGDALFLENLGRFLDGRPLLHEAARWEVGL